MFVVTSHSVFSTVLPAPPARFCVNATDFKDCRQALSAVPLRFEFGAPAWWSQHIWIEAQLSGADDRKLKG
jgi:hypothetical protein